MNMKFALGDSVIIRASDEEGIVIGYAVYKNHSDQCLIRYKAGDGRAVESWWDVDALVEVTP